MAKSGGFLERLTNKRSLAQWGNRAASAHSAELEVLRDQRKLARKLRGRLDEVLFVAEDRLAIPRHGSNAFRKPKGTDWSWRPDVWRGPTDRRGEAAADTGTKLANGATLFHDCKLSELTFRQVRNVREADLAPFGVRLDVFKFDGSFLSIVLDLPADAHKGLRKNHLFRMNTIVETERPIEIFARLNIKHGPNTDQIVRELPLNEQDVWVEFDLAYTNINEKRVEQMWVDLIFEGPEMNQVTLRDVTFSRSPRAEL